MIVHVLMIHWEQLTCGMNYILTFLYSEISHKLISFMCSILRGKIKLFPSFENFVFCCFMKMLIIHIGILNFNNLIFSNCQSVLAVYHIDPQIVYAVLRYGSCHLKNFGNIDVYVIVRGKSRGLQF